VELLVTRPAAQAQQGVLQQNILLQHKDRFTAPAAVYTTPAFGYYSTKLHNCVAVNADLSQCTALGEKKIFFR